MGERDIHAVLRTARSAMVDDLMQRLRDGKITTRNLGGQRRSLFKRGRKARNELGRVLHTVGAKGIEHVSDELERQEA